MVISPESHAPITLTLYSNPRVETGTIGVEGGPQLSSLTLLNLSQRTRAIQTLNELICMSFRRTSLIGRLYPDLIQRCLDNILASCDFILSHLHKDKHIELQSLLNSLKLLVPHVSKESNMPHVILKRIINWHISGRPFESVPDLESALISCAHQVLQIDPVVEVEGNGNVSTEMKEQVKPEPLTTLKVS